MTRYLWALVVGLVAMSGCSAKRPPVHPYNAFNSLPMVTAWNMQDQSDSSSLMSFDVIEKYHWKVLLIRRKGGVPVVFCNIPKQRCWLLERMAKP